MWDKLPGRGRLKTAEAPAELRTKAAGSQSNQSKYDLGKSQGESAGRELLGKRLGDV